MTIEIKELMSNGSILIDLTNAESSKVNGGYAAVIAEELSDYVLASRAAANVYGKSASDPRILPEQLDIGVPADLILIGVGLAYADGGRFTASATFAKLEG